MIETVILGLISGPYLLVAIVSLFLLAELLYANDNFKTAIFTIYAPIVAIGYFMSDFSAVDYLTYIFGFVGIGIVVSLVQVKLDINSYKKKLVENIAGKYKSCTYKWLIGNITPTVVSDFSPSKLSGYITTYILIWPVIVIDWLLHKVIIAIGDWIVENIGGYVVRQLKKIDESINPAL